MRMTSGSFEQQQLLVGHYSRGQLILFVGEGSFAFSSMLATALGSAPHITATSFDSYDTFCARYGFAGVERVHNLRARGAKVYFGVDITMAASRSSNASVYPVLSMKFDKIVFHYPHAGYHDSRTFPAGYYKGVHHMELIRSFFDNVSHALLRRGGEIHLTHKSTVYKRWRFNRWGKLYGLRLKRTLQFVPESFPGYVPCRGAGPNWTTTFPLGKESKTYIYSMD